MRQRRRSVFVQYISSHSVSPLPRLGPALACHAIMVRGGIVGASLDREKHSGAAGAVEAKEDPSM
jgi:hypothetical protein